MLKTKHRRLQRKQEECNCFFRKNSCSDLAQLVPKIMKCLIFRLVAVPGLLSLQIDAGVHCQKESCIFYCQAVQLRPIERLF